MTLPPVPDDLRQLQADYEAARSSPAFHPDELEFLRQRLEERREENLYALLDGWFEQTCPDTQRPFPTADWPALAARLRARGYGWSAWELEDRAVAYHSIWCRTSEGRRAQGQQLVLVTEDNERRAADQRDEQAWADARRLDTPQAYARYCYLHPEGRHVADVPPQSPAALRVLVMHDPADKALRAMYLDRRPPDLARGDRRRTLVGRALAGMLCGTIFGGLWVACLPWLGWAALGVPLGAGLVDVLERLMQPRRGQALRGPLLVALASLAGWGIAWLTVGTIGSVPALIVAVFTPAVFGALIGATAGLLRGQPADGMVVGAWWLALRGVGGAVGAGTLIALRFGPWAPVLAALAGAGGSLLGALIAGPFALVLTALLAGASTIRPRGRSHSERLEARLVGGGRAVLLACGCVMVVPLVLLILLAPAHQLGVLGDLVKPLRPLLCALVRWAPAAAVSALLATLVGMGAAAWDTALGATLGAIGMGAVGALSAWAAARGEGADHNLGPLPWYAHFFSTEKTEALYR